MYLSETIYSSETESSFRCSDELFGQIRLQLLRLSVRLEDVLRDELARDEFGRIIFDLKPDSYIDDLSVSGSRNTCPRQLIRLRRIIRP